MKIIKAPILSSYGSDPLDIYRRKWRGENAIAALAGLLRKLGLKAIY